MNERAAQNLRLFNQAKAIYGQMGMGVPAFTGKPGKGRLTAFLQQVIRQGNSMLVDYRQRQQQQQRQQQLTAQMKTAAPPKTNTSASSTTKTPAAIAKTIPRTLQSTLAQSNSGVRGRRSRHQLMVQQQGVRAANQLQAGPYLSPQGGTTSTPYGSSINLA